MSKIRLLLAVLGVLAALTTPLSAATARPTDTMPNDGRAAASEGLEGIKWFQNQATRECLDDSFGYDWVRTYRCSTDVDNKFQQWAIYYEGGGVVLQNQYTVRCAGDYGNGLVWSASCNRYDARQQWRVKNYSDGSIRLQNVYYGWCLDDSFEHELRLHPCHDGPWQRWRPTS